MESNIEVEKMKIEYAKTVSSMFMLILGGQITLAGAVFKDSKFMWLGMLAAFFMLQSSLLALSISDGALRRVSPPPPFSTKFFSKVANSFGNSLIVEFWKSLLASVTFAISMALYIIFVMKTLGVWH